MKKIALLLLMSFPAVLCGCKTISYTSPEGRHVQVTVFGVDTKIGHLEAKTPQGSIIIDNYDAETKVMDIANKALDIATKKIP